MNYLLGNAWRTQMAAVMAATFSLKPVSVAFGDGAWDGAETTVLPPREQGLYHNLGSGGLIENLTQEGPSLKFTVRIVGSSTPKNINEVCVLSGTGLQILHLTFPTRTVGQGIDMEFDVTLNPPAIIGGSTGENL